MTKVHIHINTHDGLGTDTKGLTIHELSPEEAKEHYGAFNAGNRGWTDGHEYIQAALRQGRNGHSVHVAKHEGAVVGAVSHDLDDHNKQHRTISRVGSIHPGAGAALLRHVADISEKEGSHLQGSPADARVHRLYSTLARREGGELHGWSPSTFIKKRHGQ